MSSAQKIVVFTATGEQGSSVCKYLVKEGYHVVGLTRNPESEKAKALVQIGVEVLKADLDDSASYESALEGLYGAFVNADFWARYLSNGLDAHEAGEYESNQSKTAIQACVKAGASHIVYSMLDNTDGVAPHLDSKYKTEQWAIAQGHPVTGLYTSNYLSNLSKFDFLRKEADGSFTIMIPAPDDCPLINYAVEQTGGWVVATLRDPKKYIGRRVEAASETLSVGEWAALLSELSGKTVKTLGVLGGEAYLNGTAVEELKPLGELYRHYLALYKGLQPHDIQKSREVYPEQWDTKAWFKQPGSEDTRKILGIL